MARDETLLVLYGTAEPQAEQRILSAGPLAAVIENGALRRISWRGVEVVRGIQCLVRDTNWGTYPAEDATERFEEGEGGFRYERRFVIDGGRMSGSFIAAGDATGRLRVETELRVSVTFDTNRAGLTLLHPVVGVAGEPVEIRHVDGSVEKSRFPATISPSEPARDMAGLSHRIGPVEVSIAFEGVEFDMEDQRNWSDASYKTYCRSLFRPWPYRIEAGETVRQAITITLADAPAAAAGTERTAEGGTLSLAPGETRLPEVSLVLDPEWARAPEKELGAFGVRTFVARIDGPTDRAYLDTLATLQRQGAWIDLEIVVRDGADPAGALTRIAGACREAGVSPAHVLALPAAYLKSYQPTARWPDPPSPADLVPVVRAAFPGAKVGGGMLTNFTELNRHRPDPAAIDFVCHSTTAVVHAADDQSVVETIEALPQIHESVKAVCPDIPYRLALASIGMRSNPYGAAVADNPAQVRRAMAMADPRQRGLFGAAFAVAAYATAAGSGVEAIALAAPTGPFGAIATPATWRQPLYEEDAGRKVYPIFHAVRALATLGDGNAIRINGLPARVHGVGAGGRLLLAHLGAGTTELRLPHPADIRQLDLASFDAATRDPLWLDHAPAERSDRLLLGSFAVAFIDLGAAA